MDNKTGRSSFRRSVGRYDGGTASGADHRARPKPNLNVRTAVGRVDDPWEPGQKVAVTINRRVDILEAERSQKRISEGAYRVGREIQAAYELGGRSSSDWLGAGGGDPVTARENAMMGQVTWANTRVALMKRIVKAIGEEGAKHVHRIIGDGWSYRDVAAAEGNGGERAATQVAYRFRGLLEDVTRHWAAKGKRSTP